MTPAESAEHRPVFIAGPDRSGTSLLFALLASHPSISMVRRTNFWRYFCYRYGDLGDAENFERCLAAMLRYKRLWHLDPDAERIRREFAAGEPSYGNLFALFNVHHAGRMGKTRWGDKSLHTEHYAGALFREFPGARVIHMVRDPRDRYASIQKRHDRPSKRAGAAAGSWLRSVRAAERNRRRYPARYLVLRYEDLAAEPEATLRRVCEFIGEPYAPEMLTMQGAPQHQQAGNSSYGSLQPGVISTRSIGRFREVLPAAEVAFIQAAAGRHMQRAGYEPAPITLSPGERLRFLALEMPVALARMLAWMSIARLRLLRGAELPRKRIGDPPAPGGSAAAR